MHDLLTKILAGDKERALVEMLLWVSAGVLFAILLFSVGIVVKPDQHTSTAYGEETT